MKKPHERAEAVLQVWSWTVLVDICRVSWRHESSFKRHLSIVAEQAHKRMVTGLFACQKFWAKLCKKQFLWALLNFTSFQYRIECHDVKKCLHCGPVFLLNRKEAPVTQLVFSALCLLSSLKQILLYHHRNRPSPVLLIACNEIGPFIHPHSIINFQLSNA